VVGQVLIVGGLVAIVHGHIVFGVAMLILAPIVLWLAGYLSGDVALVLLAPGLPIERRRELRWSPEES
jgi:hypothetical protein